MIIDIHTHHPAPQPQAVVCVAPEAFDPLPGQLYSVGIHPWSLAVGEPAPDLWARLEEAALHPQVAAIGETGLDLMKGGPLFRQLNAFRRHVDISERTGKPLVIHCVRAHDHIVQIRRELRPEQPWAIHGFRGKPTISRLLADAGLWLSVGERFNPDSLAFIPRDRLLAETDESSLSIEDIISAVMACDPKLDTELFAGNAARFLSAIPGSGLYNAGLP